MKPFLASLMFVVLAEMGDKTQLLAMAFACRFRWQVVMGGVFVATAANHLMAATLGSYLAMMVPLQSIKAVAAGSFILFGLWTIRGDTLHGEDQKYRFSPFWTVTVAFFMAEMGDKTQLATIALAVEYNTIITVWLGTTLGMMVSDAVGIIVGNVMGKRLPERAIKWGAALVFIAFGCYGLYENLPGYIWSPPVVAVCFVLLAVSIYLTVRIGARWGGYVPVCPPSEAEEDRETTETPNPHTKPR
ncbi:MAG TPA: TMEM165/GDT1 family protein [Thermodesulfovibrionales bacterium]|nr:TMEM165/GDT1 family protein [Thermodesulfovibrionales bacterium]